MTVGRSNSTACAPARRVSRPQGVRPRLTISVTPSAEERQQASVNGSGQRYPALCKKWIGPYLPVSVRIESAYKG